MNIASPAAAPTKTHHEIAQRSYDHFAAAYSIDLRTNEPAAVAMAIQHVMEGVELLGQAYAAIPVGDYHPGNEEHMRSSALTAVRELRAGQSGLAKNTIDGILEAVSNDFDLP